VSGVTRARDATASRAALLGAAADLFSNQGYDRTTVRQIGERAGVDPALIARYFGNKLNLYLATLADEAAETARVEITDDGLDAYLVRLLERIDARGPGPLIQALVRTDSAPELREQARAHLTGRLVEPLTRSLAARGTPAARLRAESAVAALIGVLVVRGAGSLHELSSADSAELTAVVAGMLRAAFS
jgi:AcrR family transcriptional regulator